MKLELKHLAPYLPYDLGLKILNHKSDYVGIEYSIVNGYYFIGDSLYLTYKGGSTGKSLSDVKIILRPLSDLTKEIEHNGERFVPLRKLEELFPCVEFYNDDELSYLFSDTDCRGEFFHSIELNLTLEISSKLFEWHFDIFGLIDKNIAIDINTI